MKNPLITFAVIFACAPLLFNCASQGDVNKLDFQVRLVNKKIEDMKNSTVGQMQKRQAASSSQLDELRSEVMSLQGKIEEILHLNRQLREQNKELETYQASQISNQEKNQEQIQSLEELVQKLEIRLKELEARVNTQQEVIQTMQERRIAEAKRRAQEAALAAEAARAKAAASKKVLQNSGSSGVTTIEPRTFRLKVTDTKQETVSSTSVASNNVESTSKTPDSSGTAQASDLYAAAENAYTSGKYKEAFTLFEKYTTLNPQNPKAITGFFMMGECLYQSGDYDQAILQYQKVISKHPSHPRAASSLLKQGMAFEELSDVETAKIIYKKILASYGSSQEAEIAKDRSAKLQ